MILKTKKLQATNYKGERISVNINGLIKIYPWNYGLNTYEFHTDSIIKAMRDLNKPFRMQYEAWQKIKQRNYELDNNEYGYTFII